MEFFATLSIGGAIAFVGTIAGALTFAMYVTNQIFKIIREKEEKEQEGEHSEKISEITEIRKELHHIEKFLNEKIEGNVKDIKENIDGKNQEFKESVNRLSDRMEKLSYRIIEWLGNK